MVRTVLLVVFIALAAYVFIKLIASPIKKIFKLLLHMLSGFLMLLLAEFICGFFDFSIGINYVNILVSGILGTPGVILLVLTKLLF